MQNKLLKIKLWRVLAEGPWCVRPDFLILGAQKAATTTLYHCLMRHPDVVGPLHKEVHYFDRNYRKGDLWYRAHFPSALRKIWSSAVKGHPFATGEASPAYLYHPHAPRRVKEKLPDRKFIVLLRNPVDRAYSHYQHELRKGCEDLSFEEAIFLEERRLYGAFERVLGRENYHSRNYWHYSYKRRGLYAEQLNRWFKHFPDRSQFLILRTEDFSKSPGAIMGQVCEFLGLPPLPSELYRRTQAPAYPAMDPAMRAELMDYFRPYNERLYELLGRDFEWESQSAPAVPLRKAS